MQSGLVDYRPYWECEPEHAPGMTGAADVMDCSDIRDVLQHLPVDLTGWVLDVGCGTGRVGQLVEGNYLGCDISPGMVEYARRNGEPAILIEGPDDLTPGRDTVLFLSVFTHIDRPDRRAYLEAAARIMEPGGQLLVDIIPIDPHRADQTGGPGLWPADPVLFFDDLTAAGFQIIDLYERTAPSGQQHLYHWCKRQ